MYRFYLWLENWPREGALVAARLVAAWFLWNLLLPESLLYKVLFAELKAIHLLAPYAADALKWGNCLLAGALAAGLFTRPLALALLLYLLRDWHDNLPFMALLLLLMTNGAGRVSVDYQFIRASR
jgi:uncharacterized membrane protein YphA (DoxX/SURF4 family)